MTSIASRLSSSFSWVAAWSAVMLQPVVALAAPAAHDAGHEVAHEAGHEAGHEATHSGIVWISDVVGNQGKTGLVFLFINFAILLYLLDRILFSKLRASTAGKHVAVKAELDRATEAHHEAKTMVADYRAKLDGLAAEAKLMLTEARERAEADRARIIAAAEREAEQIRASAQAAAERDADSHRRALEAEVVDRAIERAERLIRERITATDQRTMVDDYVGRLASIDFSGDAKRKSGGAA